MSHVYEQQVKCGNIEDELINLIDYIHQVDLNKASIIAEEISSNFSLLKKTFNKFEDSIITLLCKIGETDTEAAANIENDLAATFDKYCVASSKYMSLLNTHPPVVTKSKSKSILQQARIQTESLPTINSTTLDDKLKKSTVGCIATGQSAAEHTTFSTNTKMLHSQSVQCTFCSNSHIIYKCEKFNALSVNDRLTEIKQRRLCQNCLFPGHQTNQCKSKRSCFKCHKRHNTLLHNATPSPVEPQATTSNTIAAHSHLGTQITLSTALVLVPNAKSHLQEALTLAKLTRHLLLALNLNFNRLYLWTDSTIVLSWLKLSPSNLNTFIANRVAEMQQCITQKHEWRHVPSGDNPADLISRGVSAEDIAHSRLWWNGPDFLNLSSNDWPSSSFTSQNIPELRKVVLVKHSTNIDYSLLSKYSSIIKLQRVIAYCKRFIYNCRNKSHILSGPLCVTELSDSINTILKMAQQQSFHVEFKSLRKGEPVPPPSKLSALHPFIGDNDLIRVGGRLNNADLHYNNKHPIALSPDNNITRLLIRQEHLRLFHAGPQATLFSIRENYWPISGMNLIKGIIRNCMTCYKHKPVLMKPIMAALPADRFKTNFPFQVTGVDFAGPIMIKNRPGRGSILIKAYISLFVCLSSKAIHLELVSDLTSESFINTLQRFISRRGKPTVIHFDNGTNFLGANNLLKRFLRENNAHIKENLALQGITWKFLPPYSPHHGGLWESNIKSTKFHLKRVLGNTNLTFEHTYTILAQIEAILNSRPLYPMSSDPHDLEPITPSHLLIGRTLTSLPMPQVADQKPQGLKLFKTIQHRTQHFWHRWRHDYLNNLQQRNKWNSSTGLGPRVGDLVIIKDDNLPPQRWSLGRITTLIPGKDSVTRVCEIKTKCGLVKRTVHKLALLPNEHYHKRAIMNNHSLFVGRHGQKTKSRKGIVVHSCPF